jgi:phosphoribosylformylglycinamidine synthase
MIRAQVIVRPRKSIFDPQGDAVCRAIQHLGVSAVRQAHVGKCIELELEGDNLDQARAQLDTICRDLLSNPVIEDYVLTLSNGSDASDASATPNAKPAKKSAPRAKKEKA